MRMRISAAVLAVAFGAGGGLAAAQAPEAAPTFAKDVAPILYENCVTCHRPDNIAPMALIEYADARPWAGPSRTSWSRARCRRGRPTRATA